MLRTLQLCLSRGDMPRDELSRNVPVRSALARFGTVSDRCDMLRYPALCRGPGLLKGTRPGL